MKTAGVSFLLLWFSVPLPGTVHGRNVTLVLPVAAALEAKDFSDKPSGAVKFFFANQATPRIGAHLGRYAATPKTGAAGNSDERACHEALQWTLVALEKRARQAGANAVVHIASYYKNDTLSSATEFECHAGVAAHVMLKGDFVKVGGK